VIARPELMGASRWRGSTRKHRGGFRIAATLVVCAGGRREHFPKFPPSNGHRIPLANRTRRISEIDS
jgi:hypothetical protein